MRAAFWLLAHQLAGRYIRASKSAQSALTQENGLVLLFDHDGHPTGHSAARSNQLRSLAHLMVAESAQSLQNKSLRDQHLQLALESSSQRNALEVREGVHFRAARWALDDRDAGAALEWLAQLPVGATRRTLALRMKPPACWPNTVRSRLQPRKASCAVWRWNFSTTRTTRRSFNKPGLRWTPTSVPCLNWWCMRLRA